MAAKQLVFSEEARRKLRNGMNVVANSVGVFHPSFEWRREPL